MIQKGACTVKLSNEGSPIELHLLKTDEKSRAFTF